MTAFGLGCAAHIAFELIEYVLLVHVGAVELGLTLRDTLSDLGWGLVGAAAGACAGLFSRPRTFGDPACREPPLA